MTVIIDIETVPDESREHLFEIKDPPDTRELVDYRNIKTPEWRYQERKFTELDMAEWRRLQGSVTPEYLTIVALGWQEIDASEPPIKAVFVGDKTDNGAVTEEMLLKKFWQLFAHKPIVGFNIQRFDIPAILARSALLGVAPNPAFNPNAKPWEQPFIDIMLSRWYNGFGAIGLKPLCRALIPDNDIPAKFENVLQTKGDSIYGFWQSGDIETARLYLEFDIWRTRWLYDRWRGYFF